MLADALSGDWREWHCHLCQQEHAIWIGKNLSTWAVILADHRRVSRACGPHIDVSQRLWPSLAPWPTAKAADD